MPMLLLLIPASLLLDSALVRPQPLSACMRTTRLMAAAPTGMNATSLATRVGTLAFLAGSSDVVCFRRFGAYANMMTGNTISFALAIGTLQFVDALFFFSVVLAHAVGVGLYRVVDVKRKGRFTASIFAPVVAVSFAASEIAPGTRFAMLPLAMASGVVNAVSSEQTGVITSMVTGHMQKLTNFVTDALTAAAGATDATWRSGITSLGVVLAFFSGCATAALLSLPRMQTVPALPLSSAMGLAYALLLLLFDRAAWRALRRRNTGDSCTLDVYGAECQ